MQNPKGLYPKGIRIIRAHITTCFLASTCQKTQKSIVVTLLDLKNALGEVDHRLIVSTLEYHHVPQHIIDIIVNIYNGFTTSVATKDYITPAVKFEKGVLQGDCLSPLIFNMTFNTFIQSLEKSDELKQMGYVYNKILNPINWFQFADDAVAVTSNDYENQVLLNMFTRWCNWSNMIIRTDKCITFGIHKKGSK